MGHVELIQTLEQLSEDKQIEVLDFAKFLVQRTQREQFEPKSPPESLLEKREPLEISQTLKETKSESRWKKIAERVHQDSSYPGGWSESLKQEMQSFRESFHFKHDET